MDHVDSLKSLPAIGRLLDDPAFADPIEARGRALVTRLLQELVEELRGELQRGDRHVAVPGPVELARRVDARCAALLAPAPRTVVNATGVVAHTNLGRSVLSEAAAARVATAATGYLDLEFELTRGRRGDRMAHLDGLLGHLFPGSAAVAVNNNAGAILLALRALARGRDVVVSRGELVEIGGAFRIPDILAVSGAKLREVGTTNRTRAADYASAMGPKTGLVLRVHTSNFKIVGFTEEAPIAELASLARARGVPLVVDWGSGDLLDLARLGVHDEIPVGKILSDGADLVTFSCDKLLGGPQAGIAVGRPELVKRLRRDPLARVLRLDRLQIAALHATLAAYVSGRAFDEVPTLRMLALDAAVIGRRAEAVGQSAERLAPGLSWRVVPGVSRPGGGSSPVGEIPTMVLTIEDPSGDAGRIEARLRKGDPPVVARLSEGLLLLDLRTVLPEQDDALARRIAEAAGRGA